MSCDSGDAKPQFNDLTFSLNLHDGSLVFDDECIHVLEELGQLDHLLVQRGESRVAALDGKEGSTGAASPSPPAETCLLNNILDKLGTLFCAAQLQKQCLSLSYKERAPASRWLRQAAEQRLVGAINLETARHD